MEYIYTALLLHKAGQEVSETNVKKVLEAAGVKADDGRIKALMAALDGVNIEDAIATAAPAAAAPAPAAAGGGDAPAAEAKEEKKEEEEKVSEEEAAAGLGALFG
ncbi:50S ribosomal protein P1 [Candidatus Woesearchaeota archaeon]|nr:50S ribosomal protein P1 [Candidatus Woesearchaeota archaeon]